MRIPEAEPRPGTGEGPGAGGDLVCRDSGRKPGGWRALSEGGACRGRPEAPSAAGQREELRVSNNVTGILWRDIVGKGHI